MSQDVDATGDSSSRTSKNDWLNLAIKTLIDDGIDEVKIQVMAKKLDVSRSSFYWFFKSLQDLHDQLLQNWLQNNTAPIIEHAMRPAPTINRAILNVFECWVDERLFDPKLDIAVRLWARREPAVRAVVHEADRRRIDAIKSMYLRYGYDDENAFIRARVLYYMQIGHYTLDPDETLDARVSHVPAYLLAFSGQEPGPQDIDIFDDFIARLNSSRSGPED
ncbi:TetR/AcrR family transcriptional regulator [Aminobacter aganoensis]|uniref:AcrR family transcriptional regulator n=1 Tax=Aminobacter aganoensis TaxID=83264 RepID=A0A7X0CDS8_9HYPH|nr:TetR/AcrR family transcriptional regulator [Aminobacter sp. DSM 101952]KQU69759.1 TetR family transcriptional regulator [Aminobacter sp. DSM 101952]MBB6352366.1 AcrR family transcriptional regulator [Aminobacter aganoensis]